MKVKKDKMLMNKKWNIFYVVAEKWEDIYLKTLNDDLIVISKDKFEQEFKEDTKLRLLKYVLFNNLLWKPVFFESEDKNHLIEYLVKTNIEASPEEVKAWEFIEFEGTWYIISKKNNKKVIIKDKYLAFDKWNKEKPIKKDKVLFINDKNYKNVENQINDVFEKNIKDKEEVSISFLWNWLVVLEFKKTSLILWNISWYNLD